jgi:hypothetical protein
VHSNSNPPADGKPFPLSATATSPSDRQPQRFVFDVVDEQAAGVAAATGAAGAEFPTSSSDS